MSQNIIGNLLSRGKHCGASDLAILLLESWGQNIIVHHLGGRSPQKTRAEGNIEARTFPKRPGQRKDCGSDPTQNAKAEKGSLLGNASLRSRSARYVMCAPGVCNGGLQRKVCAGSLQCRCAMQGKSAIPVKTTAEQST